MVRHRVRERGYAALGAVLFIEVVGPLPEGLRTERLRGRCGMPAAFVFVEAGSEKIRVDRNGGVFRFGVFAIHFGKLPGHVAIAGVAEFAGEGKIPGVIELLDRETLLNLM
jgi:hypothetical protein